MPIDNKEQELYTAVKKLISEKGQELTDAQQAQFKKHVYRAMMIGALPLTNVRWCSQFLKQNIDRDVLPINEQYDDDFDNCLSYWLTHQGPKGSHSVKKVAKKVPRGAFETLIAAGCLPAGTRFVMKDALVRYPWGLLLKNWAQFGKSIVTTRTIRKSRPITIKRPNENAIRAELESTSGPIPSFTVAKEYRVRMSAACNKAGQEMATIINNGARIGTFPEGTMSADGKVNKRFVSELYQHLITGVYQPAIANQIELPPTVSTFVVDSLQAMPNGFFNGAVMYQRPVTVVGSTLDDAAWKNETASLMNNGPLEPGQQGVVDLADDIGTTVRDHTKKVLVGILEQALDELESQ